ncbi:UDP-N-acetylmuramoyl-L-alanyl-D-glutamate--2,6-diaminopimelate ligase [Candidatus Daviesbacteria bacterium]|nr:UDP-N-acetylmuramoyl-L-alanyl-D-glutamate--2,6-diaminopimelate ligase [Candidatus Daviesbacteria bacterium]
MFKTFLTRMLSQQTINIFFHLPRAILVNFFYGFPARGLKVIGVTGTDGKTTTVNMIYQILKDAGKKVAMISTVNAVMGGKVYDTGFHVTSPDSFMVQSLTRKAVDCGDEYLVLEVTSHALDQFRFWGIKFDIGVITNITHEHLDYHKTFESYFMTKLGLIRETNFAVVNDHLYQLIVRSYRQMVQGKIVTFGLNKGDFNQKDVKLKLNIPGDYNIENALAALAVAFTLGIDKKTALQSLENFAGIKGRMEFMKNNRGVKIIIDFAHTPNGLEQALRTLRLQTTGRLISLIGGEGFRDVLKRAMMGEIAQNLSDCVIVTSVDPRGQIEAINAQIEKGAKKAGAKRGQNFFIINDREKAINFAINELAKTGDMVGIFGKGHEQSMNLDGKTEIPWSDFEVVEKILSHG